MEKYTGKHYANEIVIHRGHECRITAVWNDDGKNGISIVPTGGYGFEVDLYEDQLKAERRIENEKDIKNNIA